MHSLGTVDARPRRIQQLPLGAVVLRQIVGIRQDVASYQRRRAQLSQVQDAKR